mmetsp:Transcript_16617/g.47852  ORF Transcript_16617/g.47852 Transcript_16617/m.47852 type:complete len:98 (+) Transcript_16617:1-294(+)
MSGSRAVIPRRTIIASNTPWGLRLSNDDSPESVEASWFVLRTFLHREAGRDEVWVLLGDAGLARHLQMKKLRNTPLQTGGGAIEMDTSPLVWEGEAA